MPERKVNQFTGTIGVLIAACAPLWFVLLADIKTKRLRRIGVSVVMLVGFAGVTVGIGATVVVASSWNDSPLQRLFLQYFLGAVPSFCVMVAIWVPLRRRALRRAQWRLDHPDSDRLPDRRSERRAAAEIERITEWHARAMETMQDEIEARGWVTSSTIRSLDAGRPSAVLIARRSRLVQQFVEGQSSRTRDIVGDWSGGVRQLSARLNEQHLQRAMAEHAHFFDSIERSRLTEEQVRAVVCFDDRVRVVAAAGSGKTSTLVAKAAFAVQSGLVAADRVLVLAFNERAAQEAQDRLARAFATARIEGLITATTFHAFGLSLIGSATGRKPAVARAIVQKRVSEQIEEIVRRLRATDPVFNADWELFRHVLFNAADEGQLEQLSPGDKLTRSGVIVRSAGERLIADWLWFNGVEFDYERPFCLDTADDKHRQYTPDFYYPAADVWHEHFALDRFGAAPMEFEGYGTDTAWKRAQHTRAGTTLFETTMAETDDGSALDRLQTMFEERGVELEPDPSRPSRGRPAVPEARLIDLIRKALEQSRLAGRDESGRAGASSRTQVFLRLLKPIQREWESMLVAESAIDFEGMVVDGARALESGSAKAEYDLVLVDEFQDMSPARALLVHGLLTRPGSRLFAVGDDWQAINAFSGGDVRQMLEFDRHWGESTTVRLERTFRSSQPICDVAGAFVQSNPDQLQKAVRSAAHRVPNAVTVQAVGSQAAQTTAAQAWLTELQQKMTAAKAAGKRIPSRSVLFLGRYNRTKQLVPDTAGLTEFRCSFSTVHRAKGLEADYVVILDLVDGVDGFPSKKRDDPVLNTWATPTESYPYGEERRLLYVALTRARRAVLVLTEQTRPSPFVEELVDQPQVHFITDDGAAAELCPKCRSSVLALRTGRFGAFLACTSRRGCSFTADVGRATRTRLPGIGG